MTEITNAQSIVGFRPAGRPANDFYPTCPEAVRALLDRETFTAEVWEPACGQGHISKILEGHGLSVVSTDLYDLGYGEGGVDFLKTGTLLAPTIITNPPYKLAEAFVWHGMRLGAEKMCLLLKLSFLEGQTRRRLFRSFPPRWVLVFSKRIQMTRNGEPARGSGMIAFAWFIWHKGYRGNPYVDWI